MHIPENKVPRPLSGTKYWSHLFVAYTFIQKWYIMEKSFLWISYVNVKFIFVDYGDKQDLAK